MILSRPGDQRPVGHYAARLFMCMTGMVMVLLLRRFTNGMAEGDLAAALAINDTQRTPASTTAQMTRLNSN